MSNNVAAIRFVQPGYIPRGVWQGKDEPSAEPSGPPGNFSDLNFPANRNALPISIISGTRPVMPVAPAPIVRPFRKSSMLEGMLIRRVQPAYPALARTARVQGPVVLDAIISKAGTMENLQVLSGHPMLVPAALEAVSQWRYRPYILNNEPIEVETRITVNFTLSGN
jgi:protein TonB